MKNSFTIRTIIKVFIVLISITGIYSCQTLQQIGNTISNLRKIQFKLDNVSNFKVLGIDIGNRTTMQDFGLDESARLGAAVLAKKLPIDFILNVAALNPNSDNINGQSKTLATLTSFDWKLFLDDTETIAGNIGNSITIPASGQSTNIPLGMNLDLFKFFSDNSLDRIMKLVLAIGGKEGSTSRIKLDAKPTINTPLGPITYPSRITIIDTEYRG